MGNAQKAHAPLLALRVHRNLRLHIQRRRRLVQHRVESLAVAVRLVPLVVPEQPAELKPLLLAERQRSVPRYCLVIDILRSFLPDCSEGRLLKPEISLHGERANFTVLVFGCIDGSDNESRLIFQHSNYFSRSTLVHDLQTSVPLRRQHVSKIR